MPRYIEANLADRLLTDGYGIDEIPSADVAPVVHAHWIPKRLCNECSLCRGGWLGLPETKFCPNCGAKMDGKENENA